LNLLDSDNFNIYISTWCHFTDQFYQMNLFQLIICLPIL